MAIPWLSVHLFSFYFSALVQEAIDDMLARGRGTDGKPGTKSSLLSCCLRSLVNLMFSSSPLGMTVLIVAHRLSTVRNADVIFVVKDGRVIEEGSHDELIAKPDGAYTTLISRQMRAQEKLENAGI